MGGSHEKEFKSNWWFSEQAGDETSRLCGLQGGWALPRAVGKARAPLSSQTFGLVLFASLHVGLDQKTS